MIKILFSFIFILILAPFAIAQLPDQRITNYLERNDQAPAIILMNSQADLSHISPTLSKEEKGRKVFDILQEKSSNTQKGVISYLIEKNIPHKSYSIINAIRVQTNMNHFVELKTKFPEIDKIIFDPTVEMELPFTEPSSSFRMVDTTWGIQMIQADEVWNLGFRGEGIVVGGQDTGYDWEVSPLKSKYRGYISETEADHNYNWHDAIIEINPISNDSINNCGLNLLIPCDDFGHGTHTMGTMVGEDEENSIGVAPGAQWIGCRNMEEGNGKPSTYIECFEWFLAPTDLNGENPRPELAPHVVNNSWRCPESEGCNSDNWEIMEMVINNIRIAGIVPVVSAGNSGSQGCGSVSAPPAIFEGSFAVGATDDVDTITNFSSLGPIVVDSSYRLKPNVSAPGRNVRSVVPGGTFSNFSGTSMAGPHVAGLVALIINANPSLSGQVDAIENIIESTAVMKMSDEDCYSFLGENIPNTTYGYGRINALAAVQKALTLSALVEETNESSINVFPNPAHHIIHVVSTERELKSISLFDMNGKQHYTSKVLSKLVDIDISHLKAGIYFLHLQTDSIRISKKIMKY